ncbi:MAG: serine/threonine-protein kinase [Planctomycetota bacterium]
MSSKDKQILERAIAGGLLTEEQATRIARIRHNRKERDGAAPGIAAVAVEKGFLSAEQAQQLEEAQDAFEQTQEIAGYKLESKLGAGSMGTVYKARQLSLDREVAIKILSPHLARKADYVERFLREARAVAKLNHPNVISGIDAGEENGVRYFVMEYASGMTVGALVERGGAMDESRVLRVALQIARALEHAHGAGLVHRDVKPDNILLTKDHIAKLCDLGLAKDSPEEGRALGTPAYISPEQAQGSADVDIRSDLYSFGCTLYHMLTGTQPFEGNAKVVMVKHLTESAPALGEREPDVSAAMVAIVDRLMEKDPADRFQSPRDLLGALQELEKGGAAPAATPPPPPPRSPARRRRRR